MHLACLGSMLILLRSFRGEGKQTQGNLTALAARARHRFVAFGAGLVQLCFNSGFPLEIQPFPNQGRGPLPKNALKHISTISLNLAYRSATRDFSRTFEKDWVRHREYPKALAARARFSLLALGASLVQLYFTGRFSFPNRMLSETRKKGAQTNEILSQHLLLA